ncbi:MAG: homoserine O-acetyltransferase [Kiritimatiellia bacterium]|jgi:homoserine O-acetyltransferase|nr:homoserine O-acetyltransferase [Kiritimatiellia bacterium]
MDEAGSKGVGTGVGVVHTQTVELQLPPEGLRLKCGQHLPAVQVAYETYGALSECRDNVIFICHALTGDAHVAGRLDSADGPVGWWDEMIGPGRGIDTDFYHVVCANILGGCRGTTGPSSINPETDRPYGSAFPPLAVEDIVDVHRLLLEQLGAERVAAVIGGSFGGMQVLDWMLRYPERIGRGICVASAGSLSAQALAFDIVGRSAITGDPNWKAGDYYGTGAFPERGLALARKVGHITYLSPGMMTHKFGRDRRLNEDAPETERQTPTAFDSDFQVESYLEHQGAKFVQRFDANSYLHITRAMDEYEIAANYGSIEEAFEQIRAKVLIIALSEDWLFPPEQSWEIARALLHDGKAVSYCRLHAPHGHDAFLIDIEHMSEVVRAFLPWVSSGGSIKATPPTTHRGDARRREFELIATMVPPEARVLDLGCGGGELLTHLRDNRQTTGMGVDIDIGHLIRCVDDGHNMFQVDMDAGLGMIPDDSYDCAILSQTIQVIHKPLLVLREMLRVAPEAIVSFPNFANWAHRVQLALGRMPKGGALPYEWHDTPNIHLFTLLDFKDLCRREGFGIRDIVCLPENRINAALIHLGCRNLGANRVLVRLTRDPNAPAGTHRA